MNHDLIGRILSQYRLSYSRIDEPQKGYRNESHHVILRDGRHVNVILYKRELDIVATITRANDVANFVAKAGLPARCTLDDRIIQMKSENYVRHAAIYIYLPGRTIPWEAYTMTHLKLLGKTLSDLHAALQLYAGALPDVAQQHSKLAGRMLTYFTDAHVQKTLAKKQSLKLDPAVLSRLQKLLAACGHLPDQQALHMDFVRGNVLFDDEPFVTGILDFEKTGRGHIVFDIARTLAFLLVDCKYKQQDKIRKYFLVSGYHKRGAAQFKRPMVGDVDILEELITFFLLHDFYKFLRHNPYESLHQNEHFTRTVTILIKRGVITRTE